MIFEWGRRSLSATKTCMRSATRRVDDLCQAAKRRMMAKRLGDLQTPERVGVAYADGIEMWRAETLMLYALTRALRPKRILEIGASSGGSGLVFANALEDAGAGQVVGIDPEPTFEPDARYHGRYILVRGRSPEQVPEAVRLLGGPVDLVLIDGTNTYSAVRADLEAVLPHLGPDSYILHHDAYHVGINQAADEFCTANSGTVVDCGLVSRTATVDADPWIAYAGLRLLRVRPRPGVEHIHEAYAQAKRPTPPLDAAVFEHDRWVCTALDPCARCRMAAKGSLRPAASATQLEPAALRNRAEAAHVECV